MIIWTSVKLPRVMCSSKHLLLRNFSLRAWYYFRRNYSAWSIKTSFCLSGKRNSSNFNCLTGFTTVQRFHKITSFCYQGKKKNIHQIFKKTSSIKLENWDFDQNVLYRKSLQNFPPKLSSSCLDRLYFMPENNWWHAILLFYFINLSLV